MFEQPKTPVWFQAFVVLFGCSLIGAMLYALWRMASALVRGH